MKVKLLLGIEDWVFRPVIVPEHKCVSREPIVDAVLT